MSKTYIVSLSIAFVLCSLFFSFFPKINVNLIRESGFPLGIWQISMCVYLLTLIFAAFLEESTFWLKNDNDLHTGGPKFSKISMIQSSWRQIQAKLSL